MIWILAVVFAFLLWQRFHPYVVTREQMKSALARALENKMAADEWHSLIHRRIHRDRYLDQLRERLVEMPQSSKRTDGALYGQPEKERIASMLDDLRKKNA